jgi:hypothetical protein
LLCPFFEESAGFRFVVVHRCSLKGIASKIDTTSWKGRTRGEV